MPEFDLRTASQLIRHRRTVKPVDMDSDREVDRALVEELLENAIWAPTHGLTQPWRFRIYTGMARLALGESLQQVYREITPADKFREDKLAKLARNPSLAPVVVAVCMEPDATGKIAEVEEIEAVACAVQNMHLSAGAAGLGGFWSTPPVLSSARARGLFELSESGQCLGLFYLGWPKPGFSWPKGVREAAESKTVWLS
jgi:nitroreductase